MLTLEIIYHPSGSDPVRLASVHDTGLIRATARQAIEDACSAVAYTTPVDANLAAFYLAEADRLRQVLAVAVPELPKQAPPAP